MIDEGKFMSRTDKANQFIETDHNRQLLSCKIDINIVIALESGP